jgi:hypothetical protein
VKFTSSGRASKECKERKGERERETGQRMGDALRVEKTGQSDKCTPTHVLRTCGMARSLYVLSK